MPKIISYLNRKFGQFTVKECIEESNGKNLGGLWMCECSCNNTFTMNGYKLHHRKSCGCFDKESKKRSGLSNRKPTQVTISMEYTQHRNNAKNNYKVAYLPKEEWLKIVMQNCYYCGEIDTRNRAEMPTYIQKNGITLTPEITKLYAIQINGVDRIDSQKDYSVDNCVPCCTMCNRMKNAFPQEEFYRKIKLIYNKHCKNRI